MAQNIFSAMELDAIGEMMNISLGSSATAVSNLLDHRVDITTPKVTVVPISEFTLGELEPAIGVEIKYVSGLEGSNIMLLKRSDVKAIVELLMGTEIPEEEFELNELTISAVCELMNQMMGAASTALSDFLGRPVNISTPQSFSLDDLEEIKRERFHSETGMLVAVHFILEIEGVLKSEFVNIMSVELARELGVSRTTLREALHVLVSQKILEARRGRGTFVTDQAAQVNDYGFSHLDQVRGELKDLFELRAIFEPSAARLACLRATEEEMADILARGEDVDRCIRLGQDRTEADREFHAAIVRATHNSFMMRLLPMINRAVAAAIASGQHKDQLAEDTRKDHALLMDFFRKRDAAGAGHAMAIHMHHSIDVMGLGTQ